MSDDQDKWGPLSNAPQRKTASQLAAEDAAENRARGPEVKQMSSSKMGLIVGGLMALVLVAMGGFFIVNTITNGETDGKNKGPTSSNTNQPEPVGASNKPWWDKGENQIPIDLEVWQKKNAVVDVEQITDEQEEWAKELLLPTPLYGQAQINFPSEAGGYVSDPSKATDDKGLPNTQYAYITQEILTTQSTLIAERFLNPVYGSWGAYQFSDNNAAKKFPIENFRDVVSDDYYAKLKKDKSILPVYADWESNDYGREDLVEGGGLRWIGQIQNATADFKYDGKVLNYRTTVTYDVLFTSYTENQKKVEQKATLKLVFVVSPLGAQDPKSFRLAVDGGSLTLR